MALIDDRLEHDGGAGKSRGVSWTPRNSVHETLRLSTKPVHETPGANQPEGPHVTIHTRGEAYLAAKRGAEAAAEFQKILDHRGIVATDPVGALAHLQSGRAFVLSGDKAKAKTAYQDFLTLWKDADADIPIYQQAKAEYAKLR